LPLCHPQTIIEQAAGAERRPRELRLLGGVEKIELLLRRINDVRLIGVVVLIDVGGSERRCPSGREALGLVEIGLGDALYGCPAT
jgi:hypothetical protein